MRELLAAIAYEEHVFQAAGHYHLGDWCRRLEEARERRRAAEARLHEPAD